MTITRSQSVADLDRKLEEKHGEVNARIDQLQSQMETNQEELRSLLRSQARGPSQESDASRNVNDPPQNPPRNYSTRLSKVELPRFDGKKVKDWLYKCDQFFLLDETPPESRVRLASIHLEGLALQWHLNYMRGRFDQYPFWTQYAADVKRRFGDLYEDPLAELIQVRHTGSIQTYIDEFELALTQVSILSENALSIFISNLDSHTQSHVRMFNPSTLAHAINLARLLETTKPANQKPTYKQSYSTKFASPSTQPPLIANKPTQKPPTPAAKPFTGPTYIPEPKC